MKAKLSARTIATLKAKSKAFEVVDSDIKGFLLRVQPTGRMTFYYSYRIGTDRKRVKIGVLGSGVTLQQARDKAVGFASQVINGEDIQANKKHALLFAKDAKAKTLKRFLETHYTPWALANLKAAQGSIDRIYYSFPELMDVPLSKISVSYLEKWRTEKLNLGRKPSTVNRCVGSLRSSLTKAVLWEIIDEHPLQKLKALQVDNTPKVRYLSWEEEQRLLIALTARDVDLKRSRTRNNEFRKERGYSLLIDLDRFQYADRMTPLITLSLKTGMRRGELFDLEWVNVDFERDIVTVTAETSKSKRTRHIPLSPSARFSLEQWKKQSLNISGRVFPADDGGRLDNVRKSWASILKEAGITQFRWHDMRHDFASKLVMKGVPLNTVRELCGHASIKTTLRYAHLAPDHKSEAVSLLG